MEAKDLRSLSVDELAARIRQWGDELFRSRFKAGTAEAKDTSIFKKLRKDIARANTVINEKVKAGSPAPKNVLTAPVSTSSSTAEVADKPVKKAATKKKSSVKSKE